MNERLEELVARVLGENGVFSCNDGHIRSLLSDAEDDGQRLRVIREEYAKAARVGDGAIAGEYPTVPFFEREERDLSRLWDSFDPEFDKYVNKVYVSGGNHFCADYGTVIRTGFSGLIDRIDERMKSATDDGQTEFLDRVRFAARAVIEWSHAYADALFAAADKESDAVRREELLRTARICEKVPEHGATSFREAVQSFFFVFILVPDGVGLPDRYLYPYYKADAQKGEITRKEALELIEELIVRIFAFHGKDEARSGNVHGALAGYTPDGECGHNECTSLFLEAIAALPLWRPQMSYRVTAKTTAAQFKEALDAHLKRPDVITFANDDEIIPGLVGAGVAYGDAADYSPSGCNETLITGRSHPGALEGLINMTHSLERTLEDTASLEDVDGFEEFYGIFERNLQSDLDIVFRYSYERDRYGAEYPMTALSLMTDGCICAARSIAAGGAKYDFCTWCLTGLVDLADSLGVIEQFVFEEKRFTIAELCCFIRANWTGYEDKRAYILNNARYFGNDDDRVDLLVNRVCASVDAFAKKYTPYRGGRYLFGTLTGYELSHMTFGKATGATPNGRRFADPLTASVSAFPGAARSGMSAYLRSAAKLDHDLLRSSVVVNMQLDRALADGEEKRARLAAMLRAYFDLGGIQLQINYLSADELKNAKRDPEKYKDLRVRVTGFSGFFTTFDADLQDEIIERDLHGD